MRALLARAWLVVACAIAGAAPAAAEPPALEYLYIDANEGGASGGHVALRVGDDVFHFEYRAPGWLVLQREGVDDFIRHYSHLENRTIHVTPIHVPEDAYRRVRERLVQRYVTQRAQLEELDSVRADRVILAGLADNTITVEGAGFFDVTPQGDPALAAVRDRVTAAYGMAYLDERTRALRQQLGALTFDAVDFPQRYRDIATALAAIDVIDHGRPLAPSATVTSTDDSWRVTPDDERLIAALSDSLAEAVVRLLESRRSDWGFPVLLALARLAALERTRATGWWTMLEAPGLRYGQALSFAAARARLGERFVEGTGFPEREFVDVEGAANGSVRSRASISDAVPARRREDAAPVRVGTLAVAQALEALAAREAALVRRIGVLYRYHLIGRNCVTELLGELAGAVGTDVAGSPETAFIPAASISVVRTHYAVGDTVTMLSRRRARLAELYATANPLGVFMRESNVLTSTLYRRNPEDSVFLFFTDDNVALRPLLGAANLVTALVATTIGVATAPFDAGERLRTAARGVVFSLPELVFQNIRKGSYASLPRKTTQ